jgi:hypothetical protein
MIEFNQPSERYFAILLRRSQYQESIILYIKASSSCGRAAYRADQGYCCQFAIPPSCYGGFVVMVDLSFCCSTYNENVQAQFLIYLSLILS